MYRKGARDACLALAFILTSIVITRAQCVQSPSINIFTYGQVNWNSDLKWLHTEGKIVKNSDGQIVILRGANFMGYEVGAWDQHTEMDYAKMSSWGFNVVRLPIAWNYIEPQPGAYDLSYFEKYVDRDIAWAKKHGIYIILDMHQWKWSPFFTYGVDGPGNGFPTWEVSNYPNSKEGMGQAVRDFMLGMGPNGTAAGETNPSMQERLVSVWRLIAQRYANEPCIASYELLNEPYHSSELLPGGLDPTQTAKYLFPFYSEIVEAIRTADSHHIISYEPVGGWDSGRAQKLNYSNLMYTFHFYGENPYSGNETKLEEDFMYRYSPPFQWQSDPSKWDIPIWLGEFGTDGAYWNPNASLYVRDMIALLDRLQIGWTWWTYWKSDSYGKALLYANGTERIELVKYLEIKQ